MQTVGQLTATLPTPRAVVLNARDGPAIGRSDAASKPENHGLAVRCSGRPARQESAFDPSGVLKTVGPGVYLALRWGLVYALVVLGSILVLYFSQRQRLAFDRLAAAAAKQRQEGAERLELALEGSGLALFDWDIVGDRLYHSAQASAMRDEPAIETTAPAAELRSFVHPDDLDTMLVRLKAALTGEAPIYHAEFRIRKRSGAWLWLRARGRVVERDSSGRALRVAGTYADINERKIAEERLRRLAEFDTLTDLPNRAQFRDRLQQAMARATSDKAMALLYLDYRSLQNRQ